MTNITDLIKQLEQATTFTEGFAIIDELYPILKERLAIIEENEQKKFINQQMNECILTLLSEKNTQVAVFANEVIAEDDEEVQRLLVDLLDGKEKLDEAMVAVEYQNHFKVRLERPQPEYNEDGTPKAGFDYWITETGDKLDFMFTMYGSSESKINKLNRFFAHNDEALRDKKDGIQEHLEKADIVPIDLRSLTTENRLILVNYVLSLSYKQQNQVVFILGE